MTGSQQRFWPQLCRTIKMLDGLKVVNKRLGARRSFRSLWSWVQMGKKSLCNYSGLSLPLLPLSHPLIIQLKHILTYRSLHYWLYIHVKLQWGNWILKVVLSAGVQCTHKDSVSTKHVSVNLAFWLQSKQVKRLISYHQFGFQDHFPGTREVKEHVLWLIHLFASESITWMGCVFF